MVREVSVCITPLDCSYILILLLLEMIWFTYAGYGSPAEIHQVSASVSVRVQHIELTVQTYRDHCTSYFYCVGKR